jgi:hypothetical protein
MKAAARQLVDAVDGFALGKTHLIIDRDTKYCEAFREILGTGGVKTVRCPPRVPQCNAYAERFVRSIKSECLSRLILLSETHLRRTIALFVEHYRRRRNHQGIGNRLIEPPNELPTVGPIRCRSELGGDAQLLLPAGRTTRGRHLGRVFWQYRIKQFQVCAANSEMTPKARVI